MNNKTKAVLLMITSAMSFSLMQSAIVLTADRIPLFEQLFFRNFIIAIPSYLAIKKASLNCFGKKENRTLLLFRSLFGYLGMIATFYATAIGNLGDVTTLLKMSPAVVVLFAVIFLKEKITKYQIIGLLITTAGVCFVSNPQFNSDLTPLIVALIASILSGAAYTLVGALKGREHPTVIIFFFSFFSSLITLPLLLSNFVMPTAFEWLMLLLIGLSAAAGQLTITYAYSYTKASEISLYDYSGIIFSMVFGYIFLSQTVKFTSIIGAALIFLAGIIMYWGNRMDS